MMDKRVLIIEDNLDIAELVSLHLRDLGYCVEHALDGKQGLELALSDRFDLVVLDLTLPEMDGVDICRRIREMPRYLPVLMLTARDSEIDRVVGLEMGADDYLTKPFGIRELLARIKALFRTVEATRNSREPSGRFAVGELIVDQARRSVTIEGDDVQLTAKEFDLLTLFARQPGRVFTRSQLLESVWGYSHAGYEHTVNSHINRLRSKIERDPGKPYYLRTVWGVGYRFFDPHVDG